MSTSLHKYIVTKMNIFLIHVCNITQEMLTGNAHRSLKRNFLFTFFTERVDERRLLRPTQGADCDTGVLSHVGPMQLVDDQFASFQDLGTEEEQVEGRALHSRSTSCRGSHKIN